MKNKSEDPSLIKFTFEIIPWQEKAGNLRASVFNFLNLHNFNTTKP